MKVNVLIAYEDWLNVKWFRFNYKRSNRYIRTKDKNNGRNY
jgi:hypothetical protein